MNEILEQAMYTNPLSNDDFPDASIIFVENEGYFAFATHDEFSPTINNVLVKHSWDLIHWGESVGALHTVPAWATTCNKFWAPHVVKVSQEFRMYYSAEPDTKDGMCLAMASSSRPNNFTDCGFPISRKPGTTYKMIDPCFFIDPVSGKNLLYYGSQHEPIEVVELEKNGTTFSCDPVPVLYPGEDKFNRLREGAFVTYKSTWKRYFLWVSGDNTWEEDGYAVSVYWSDNPMSVFKKIPGDNLVLRSNKHWDAPGHNSIIEDAGGNEWMIYHAVDTRDRYIPGTKKFLRKMCMDRIHYSDDGWPSIQNGSPSFTPHAGPALK